MRFFDFLCPFCWRNIESSDLVYSFCRLAMIHADPPCSQFLSLASAEFVYAVAVIYGVQSWSTRTHREIARA